MGTYGVIICNRCGNAGAIDLRAKTNTCTRCGKGHRTESMRLFFKSNDLREIAAAVAELNSEIHAAQ